MLIKINKERERERERGFIGLAGWLNLFNAEWSPERYWRGPR